MLGYSEDGETTWWREAYRHLKSAEAAAINAMVHNLESQIEVFSIQDTIKNAIDQTMKICAKKGILLEEQRGDERRERR